MTYIPSTRLEHVFISKFQVSTAKNGMQVGGVALEILGIKPGDAAALVRLQQTRVGGLVITLAPEHGSAEEAGEETVTLSANGQSVTITAREFEELAGRADAVAARGDPPEGVDKKTGEIREGGGPPAPGAAKKKPLTA